MFMFKYSLKYTSVIILGLAMISYSLVSTSNLTTVTNHDIPNKNTPSLDINKLAINTIDATNFNVVENKIKHITPKKATKKPLRSRVSIIRTNISPPSSIKKYNYNLFEKKTKINISVSLKKNKITSPFLHTEIINNRINHIYSIQNNPITYREPITNKNLPFFNLNTKDLDNAIRRIPYLESFNLASNSHIKQIYKLGINLMKNSIRSRNDRPVHIPVQTFNSRNIRGNYRITVGFVFKTSNSGKRTKFKKEFKIFNIMYRK